MLIERQDFKGLGLASLHARRAHRHARNRQANNRRLFLQQSIDQIRGHMAFHHVAIDQGRVTRIELFRYRLLALEIGEVFAKENFRLDFETIL
jgi:hypothetical protein